MRLDLATRISDSVTQELTTSSLSSIPPSAGAPRGATIGLIGGVLKYRRDQMRFRFQTRAEKYLLILEQINDELNSLYGALQREARASSQSRDCKFSSFMCASKFRSSLPFSNAFFFGVAMLHWRMQPQCLKKRRILSLLNLKRIPRRKFSFGGAFTRTSLRVLRKVHWSVRFDHEVASAWKAGVLVSQVILWGGGGIVPVFLAHGDAHFNALIRYSIRSGLSGVHKLRCSWSRASPAPRCFDNKN